MKEDTNKESNTDEVQIYKNFAFHRKSNVKSQQNKSPYQTLVFQFKHRYIKTENLIRIQSENHQTAKNTSMHPNSTPTHTSYDIQHNIDQQNKKENQKIQIIAQEQMLQKPSTYQNEEAVLYTLNQKDYKKLKQWLSSCHHNYQPKPMLSSQFEYIPVTFLLAFKMFVIEEAFFAKFVRQINSTAGNGFKISVGIEDMEKNIYIGTIFQKKQIFCSIDLNAGLISLLEDQKIAFYVLLQRLKGNIGGSKGLSKLRVIIKFMLVSHHGDVFYLGFAKYPLAQRSKQAAIDLPIQRIDYEQKIGHFQLTVLNSQNLDLSYFIPPATPIDPTTTILPPLKNLVLPSASITTVSQIYSFHPYYQISLKNLQIKIKNYEKLIKCLEKCNPFFTQFHHQNVKMDIVKINLIVGFHNGFMIVQDLPINKPKDKEKEKDRDKERLSPRHGISSKNISKVFQQPKKPEQSHYIYNLIRLTSAQSSSDTVTLRPQSKIAKTSSLPSQSLISNDHSITSSQSINLYYFDSPQGQLISILQFTIRYTLYSQIQSEETVKANLFWAPIVFNQEEQASQVRMDMIAKFGVLGFPIQWKDFGDAAGIEAEIGYQCVNENFQLHKNTRKDRLTSFGNIRQNTDRSNKEKSYLDLLIQEEEKQDFQSKNRLTTNRSNVKIATQTSTLTKQQQMSLHIEMMLRKLQRSIKPRLRLQQCKIPPQFLASQPKPQISTLNLINKSFKLTLRLREYLPLTTNIPEYYLPRKLLLNLFIFRHHFQQLAYINKDAIKAGIPVQLQNPTKMDYHGFLFQVVVNNVTKEEASVFQDGGAMCCTIRDEDNFVDFGVGVLDVVGLFAVKEQENVSRAQSKQQGSGRYQKQMNKVLQVDLSNQKIGYFKIPIMSKTGQNSHLRGYLLFQYTLTAQQSSTSASTHKPTKIPLSKLLPTMATKQGQKLRISAYQGNQQAQTAALQLAKNYKKSTQSSYISELTHKQLNNDIQILYQIGYPSYAWFDVCHNDSSGNNVFTFEVGSGLIEIVTDKVQFYKQAVEAKGEDGDSKVMGMLGYVLGKQGAPGYYQAKIPQNVKIDFLIKIMCNQWCESMPQQSIAYITIKRNTIPFRQLKLRLTLKFPLIDRIYPLSLSLTPSSLSSQNQIKFDMPNEILDDHGQFLSSLTANIVYNSKDKSIVVYKISDKVGEIGYRFVVLLGVYFDKGCLKLNRLVRLEAQVMQGESIRLVLGQVQAVKVPLCSEQMRMNQRIFRIQTNNDQYRLLLDDTPKLHYFSKMDKNEPQLMLHCLWPRKDKLIVSIISLQNKLLKKYMFQLQCTIPHNNPPTLLQIQGYHNQNFFLILKNPYNIEYSFYLSCTSKHFLFKDLFLSSDHEINHPTFKIKAHSQLRVIVEVIGQIRDQQYIILNDASHVLVGVWLVKRGVKYRDLLGFGVAVGESLGVKDRAIGQRLEMETNSYQRLRRNSGASEVLENSAPNFGLLAQKQYM